MTTDTAVVEKDKDTGLCIDYAPGLPGVGINAVLSLSLVNGSFRS